MRNRGIELFLMPPDALAGSEEGERVMIGSEVPGRALPSAMASAHVAFAQAATAAHRAPPTIREAQQWAAMTRGLLLSGWPLQQALEAAWKQTYMHGQSSEQLKQAATDIFSSHLQSLLNVSFFAPNIALIVSY